MEGNVSFTFHLQAPAFWKHTDTRKKKVTPKIAYCLCGAKQSHPILATPMGDTR